MDLKGYLGQVVEWSDRDLDAANLVRAGAKWSFDLLRNVMILGLLKFIAEKSGSQMVYAMYLIASVALVAYLFSYMQSWRLRPFAFLGNGRLANVLNAAVGGSLAGLLFLAINTPIAMAIEEIAKAQQ